MYNNDKKRKPRYGEAWFLFLLGWISACAAIYYGYGWIVTDVPHNDESFNALLGSLVITAILWSVALVAATTAENQQ